LKKTKSKKISKNLPNRFDSIPQMKIESKSLSRDQPKVKTLEYMGKPSVK